MHCKGATQGRVGVHWNWGNVSDPLLGGVSWEDPNLSSLLFQHLSKPSHHISWLHEPRLCVKGQQLWGGGRSSLYVQPEQWGLKSGRSNTQAAEGHREKGSVPRHQHYLVLTLS